MLKEAMNWVMLHEFQGAPHPPSVLMADVWTKPYPREYAAYPAEWLKAAKFWPSTGLNSSIFDMQQFFRCMMMLVAKNLLECSRLSCQGESTTCTAIATSSAPSSPSLRWLKKQQLQQLLEIVSKGKKKSFLDCFFIFLFRVHNWIQLHCVYFVHTLFSAFPYWNPSLITKLLLIATLSLCLWFNFLSPFLFYFFFFLIPRKQMSQ